MTVFYNENAPVERLRMTSTTPRVFYNENDLYVAQWLENLTTHGLIAPGRVDARSIVDVQPEDLEGVRQAHFFAGLGGWTYALELAGWPDDQAVWTGSCPCQPFSQAGRRKGEADARHLWPEWFRLIEQCRPAIVVGEQVGSPDGLRWLDAVCSDLEGAGYAVGAADLCAAGVGAPHLRQRLYFLAVSSEQRCKGQRIHLRPGKPQQDIAEAARGGALGELGDARGARLSIGPGPEERFGAVRLEGPPSAETGATRGFWADAEWWLCRDGKARPAQPGAFPLADGAPARVGRLRASGNAIVPQVAALFVRAAVEALNHEATRASS